MANIYFYRSFLLVLLFIISWIFSRRFFELIYSTVLGHASETSPHDELNLVNYQIRNCYYHTI